MLIPRHIASSRLQNLAQCRRILGHETNLVPLRNRDETSRIRITSNGMPIDVVVGLNTETIQGAYED